MDDMVDTAGTLCNGAKALIEVGGAKEIIACASHGVLSGPAIQRINDSVIRELILLDTIPLAPEKKCDKITYLSTADLFADAIHRTYDEQTMSEFWS